MNYKEFTRWCTFLCYEPVPAVRQELAVARLEATLYNVNGAKPAAKPKDFVLDYWDTLVPEKQSRYQQMTDEEHLALAKKAKLIAAQINGQIKNG